MQDYGGEIMCKKLKELDGLTPNEILLSSGANSVPISIHSILRRLGISYRAMDFTPYEQNNENLISSRGKILGAVTILGDDICILYRKDDSSNRIRFTLAHELAHCCLDSKSLRDKGHIEFRFDENSTNPKEFAANVFAGELLIPKNPLVDLYNKLIVPAVDVIANEFQVSINVMKARLEYLGLGYYVPQNYDLKEDDNG